LGNFNCFILKSVEIWPLKTKKKPFEDVAGPFLFKTEKRKQRPTGVAANTLISADCSLRFRMSSFYGKLLKHIVHCSEHLAYVAAAGHWILAPKSCHIFFPTF
jgi:hypothetical protein